MNGHRSCTNAKSNTFLYEHFNIPGHSFEKAYIQIIDFVDPDISDDIKRDLRTREDYWIDKLGTAYPLGLNDNKKGCGNISQGKAVNYFNGSISRYKRGRGKKRPPKRKSRDEIIANISDFKLYIQKILIIPYLKY